MQQALVDEVGAAAADLRVRIACSAPDTVVVTIATAARGPLTRSFAVGDVVPELRERVIAVVIAEALHPVAVATVTAAAPPARPGGPTLAVHGLGRMFARGGATLLGAEVAVGLGRLRVGGGATTASSDDPLGALRPWVVDGSAAVTLACWRALCGAARVEAGVAFATASSTRAGVTAETVAAPFIAPGLEAEASFALGSTTFTVAAGAAWAAAGLVVLADQRAAVHLDGPMVTLAIGARFAP